MDYSGKNIPIPSTREYIKRLLEKTEQLIKRMRWKAFYFLKDSDEDSDVSNSNSDNDDDQCPKQDKFGFKTKRTPPQVPDMIDFERDLLNMVENVEFGNVNDEIQSELKNDLIKINSSDDILIC